MRYLLAYSTQKQCKASETRDSARKQCQDTHTHTHTRARARAQVRVKCEGFEENGEWLYGIIRQFDAGSEQYTIVLHAGYADVVTGLPSERVQVCARARRHVFMCVCMYVHGLCSRACKARVHTLIGTYTAYNTQMLRTINQRHPSSVLMCMCLCS